MLNAFLLSFFPSFLFSFFPFFLLSFFLIRPYYSPKTAPSEI
jgi:hypothetical protein